MIVYRVDNWEGKGPFMGSADTANRPDVDRSAHSHRPMPYDDVKGWNDLSFTSCRKYIFGFKSLDQLINWFREELDILAEHEVGWYITKYEVEEEHVLMGNHQLAFVAVEAERIERLDILETVMEKV